MFGFERNALQALGRLKIIIENSCQTLLRCNYPKRHLYEFLIFETALQIADRVIYCSYLQRLSLLRLGAKYLDTLHFLN